MANFHFPLQTVLKLRESARAQRRVELSAAYEVEQVLRRQAEALSSDLDQLKDRMRRAAQPGEIDVDSLLLSHRYELVLRGQMQNVESQMQQMAEEIERRRALLVEADREVRILEKLRERQHDVHETKQKRQEIKEMDEIAAKQSDRASRHLDGVLPQCDR